ncbi:MAG: hypothetical protein ACOZQL_37585 [Myxococcota bacterium]
MKRLALGLLLGGCMTQAWTLPQPYFRTTQPDGAWGRAVTATERHCGGISTVNDEASVIVGRWMPWTTGDGLVLTQCLVSLLRGDEYVRDVRVTFAARRCPLADLDQDLEALARTCEVSDTVPEQVKNGLVDLGRKLEADLNAVR